MLDYFFRFDESVVNKMIPQTCVLLMVELGEVLQISCKSHQVTESLPKSKIIVPP